MSNYTKTTNFATKDSLPSGDANKIVKGAEINTEFDNIATAVATKSNTASPTFTGTVTIPTADINGGAIDGTTIGGSSASAVTATTLVANTSLNIASDGATVTGIKDEDDMSSNSATKLATQQSIKAYVDSQVTAQDLDVTTDFGTIAIDLDSETLTVTGGTGLSSSATGNAVTLNIDSTVATLTGSQTLTNKTLTAPTISGNLTTDGTIDGRDVATDGSKLDGIESNATADQTAAEIRTLVGSATDSNVFTDADHSKLDGIEASADVTDTANVTAAGALMDSECTSLASVKALNQGVATTDSPSFAGLTVDTDTLSVDATNNRVGIGTSSPTVPLDVNGSGTGIDLANFGGSAQTNYSKVNFNTDTLSSQAYIIAYGSGNAESKNVAIKNTNSDGDVFFTAGNAERMRIDSSGNVGIGTNSPTRPLSITDTTSDGSGGVIISSYLPVLEMDDISGSGTSFKLEHNQADTIFKHDSTERMRIDSSGNVGIGTSSPQSDGNTTNLEVSSAFGARVLVANTDTNGRKYGFYSSNSGIFGLADYTASGTPTRMAIDSSGRVGIGTNAPATTLDVRKSTGDLAYFIPTTSGHGSTYISSSSNKAEIGTGLASTEFSVRSKGSGGFLTFDTSGSERMRIDASGRVGIGGSPTEELHLNRVASGGDVCTRIQNNTGTSGSTATLRFSVTPNSAFDSAFVGSDRFNALILGSNTAERMRIDSSGNVGIGTTSPSAKLDVNGTAMFNDFIHVESAGGYGRIELGGASGAYIDMKRPFSDDYDFRFLSDGNGCQLHGVPIMLGGTYSAGIDSGTAGIVLQQDKPIFTRDVNGNYLRNLLKHGSGGRIELGQTGTALITGIDLKAGASGHIKVHSRVTSNNADLELRRNDSGYSFKLAADGSGIIIRHTGNSYNAGFQTRYWYGNTMLSNSGSTGTAYGVLVSSSNLYPAQSGVSGLYRDNAVDLGHSSARWDDVYATNGTIQTSDEREKQDIETLSEAEQRVAVAAKGLLRKFRWKDKVAAKGDDARIHFGIIAQDLEAAFTAEGLDPSKYAMFIKTEWWVGDKVYPAVEEETDEEGNVITEAVEESTDPEHHYDNQADAPDDAVYHYRMGIRYSELLAFIISAI